MASMRPSWQEPPEPATSPQLALPRLTPMVRWLLFVNVGVFLINFVAYLLADTLFDSHTYQAVLRQLELDPVAWASHFPFVPIWQLATYGFLHSTDDAGHIVGNMLMLYFMGGMLEEIIGSRRFLLTYFAAQLAGALLFLAPALFGHITGPALGASGAVLGITVATATLRPRQTVFLIFIPITLRVMALGILGLTVFEWLLSMKHGSDGVAHLVHLGGIAYGFFAVRSGWIYKDPVEAIDRRRAVHEVERASEDAARMDQLLAKIHREGMSSLSRSEKEFLKRVSGRR
jgi:membrane associated rhomboid family serine protease